MIDPQAFLAAIKAHREQFGDTPLTCSSLEAIVERFNTAPMFTRPALSPQLGPPPEFPRRMVRCGENHEVLETCVVHTFSELQALQKTGVWYRWEEGEGA